MKKRNATSELDTASGLGAFHPAVRDWFCASFAAPTKPQELGWPPIRRGESTLILAPTGSGKTLAAFLWCIDRIMFRRLPEKHRRCRILYVSPLKALAVDVERNLRAPIVGVSNLATTQGVPHNLPSVAIRTGDTPAGERAHFRREPSDILITTPESLYLLLTSGTREVLRSVDTVIVDEIHALVPNKRGAHLALSIERLATLCDRPLQRIGLSATQRPLDEVAHFLGGAEIAGVGKTDSGLGIRGWGVGNDEFLDEFSIGNPKPETRIPNREVRYRPVTIVDAGEGKRLDLHIEVPVEDMARLGEIEDIPSGPASQSPVRKSIWTAMHPKLLKLIQKHQSTLIFVNSRRLAERLAAALNELAGETLVRAHHGSLAPPQRNEIEDRLKSGTLRGLVATSSLELGIDMGAIDLVVQIEAPPSVATGMQRIGRGGHHVGATSCGVIFPKYRADLVACAAVTRAMRDGQVEATRYPRNPLDVLAQQIVAMASLDEWKLEELYAAVRCAAPFADLSRQVFEGVLDMLAGRYPSDEFAELRPRITWDRVKNSVTARHGARRIAVMNGGTIPDRGLYGVFLAGAPESKGSRRGSARVGELDEEMVFESRQGETFLLGASTWRIEEITHDRVLVSPAPGEPGKMPFWKGDAVGRSLEFGQTIGKLVRTLRGMSASGAITKLVREHDLDQNAAENLVRYLADQAVATGVVPDDETIVIERCRDELGDWRVCVLTPLGGRIHAPWSIAVTANIREKSPDPEGIDVETMWTDDGFVVRFPDVGGPPDPSLMIPDPGEVERLVIRQLGATALFAAKFREAAARALLLPRVRPGGRTPLWQQRKRAADLLAVASRFGSFPMVLEAYRECLREVFDIPCLVATLRQIANRSIHVATVDSTNPSPFAASLLFGYVANYIYDGDAPLAERRAQALAIDQSQLRELLGDADLRELLDATALDEIESQLQAVEEGYRARSADGLHDLLLRLGDLTKEEVGQRTATPEVARSLSQLVKARRVIPIQLWGETRYIAVEDASRYRDVSGAPLPPGIPETFLKPVEDPRADLLRRYARTHGPFTTDQAAGRFGISRGLAESTLKRLAGAGKLLEGEFRPGGLHREWCDAEVLRLVRRRSLAKLRHAVEPVNEQVLGRLATNWQGTTKPRRGLDALLDAVESLQGAALPASILESEILPARIEEYSPADLDALMAAGEVVWCGVEPLGEHDGRVALFLTDHLPRLWQPRPVAAAGAGVKTSDLSGSAAGCAERLNLSVQQPGKIGRRHSGTESRRLSAPRGGEAAHPSSKGLSEKALQVQAFLNNNGASFFAPIHQATGGGYPGEAIEAIWDLVWRGVVTNDTFSVVRAFTRRAPARARRHSSDLHTFCSRRMAQPSSLGRWSLVEDRISSCPSPTEMSAAWAQQLLNRYGVLTREVMMVENIPGGFSSIYPVLKMLEESGRIRRGFFVAGLGATQFALPAALDLLRSLKDDPDPPEVVQLAATDPANPYGAILKWPSPAEGVSQARVVGATVVLVNGALAAYLRRGNAQISVFLPDEEPNRSRVARALAGALRGLVLKSREAVPAGDHRRGLLIAEVNGSSASSHYLSRFLEEAGFAAGAMGYHLPRTVVGDR